MHRIVLSPSSKDHYRCCSPEPQTFSDSIASAPPLNLIQRAPGYEEVTFDPSVTAPPRYEEAVACPTERPALIASPVLTENEVRETLLRYVSEHSYFRKRAAKKMEFTSIKITTAYYYCLETHAERRETMYTFEPYRGGPLDTPQAGTAPLPWEIPVNVPPLFSNFEEGIEVPHTAIARPCHVCTALRRVFCNKCGGEGGYPCNVCNRRGCHRCFASGRIRCDSCEGTGQMTCLDCAGAGQLKCYIKLKVTWNNYTDEFAYNNQTVPLDTIRKVEKIAVFQEEGQRIFPFNHFPEEVVNNASSSLIEKHLSAYQMERINRQRHMVAVVPVAIVNFQWKEKFGTFHIVGYDKKVHFPEYDDIAKCNIL